MTASDLHVPPVQRHGVGNERSFLVMLAAHPVHRDPRVVWEIVSAAREHQVLALGLTDGVAGTEDIAGATVQHADNRPGGMGAIARAAGTLLWRALRRPNGARHLPVAVAALAVFTPLALLLSLSRGGGTQAGAVSFGTEVPPAPGLLARAKALLGRMPPTSALYQALRFCWLCRHLVLVTSRFYQELCRLEGRKPSILHANDFDTLIAAALFKVRHGCRLVYDAHEFWPYSHTHAGRLQRWFFLSLERLVIAEADQMVTINPLMANTLERAYGLTGVVTVLNAEPWRDERQPSPRPLPPEAAGKLKFLFIGNFTPSRGLEELIDAWQEANLDDAVLILRGPNSTCRWQLERFLTAKGSAVKNILFAPPVSEDELIATIQQVDVGIIPYKPIDLNYRYCCPNKLSQYIHGGVMILAANTEFVGSVVENNKLGLVYDAADRDGIVRALRRAANDAEFRQACRNNALAFGRAEFNWQAQEEKLLRCYRTV